MIWLLLNKIIKGCLMLSIKMSKGELIVLLFYFPLDFLIGLGFHPVNTFPIQFRVIILILIMQPSFSHLINLCLCRFPICITTIFVEMK